MPVTATLLLAAEQFELWPLPYTRTFNIGSTVEGDIIVAFLAGGGDVTVSGATVVGETATVVSAGGGDRALYAAQGVSIELAAEVAQAATTTRSR